MIAKNCIHWNKFASLEFFLEFFHSDNVLSVFLNSLLSASPSPPHVITPIAATPSTQK